MVGNILDKSNSFFFQINKVYLSVQIDLCVVSLSNASELSIRLSVFALPALVSFMVVIGDFQSKALYQINLSYDLVGLSCSHGISWGLWK